MILTLDAQYFLQKDKKGRSFEYSSELASTAIATYYRNYTYAFSWVEMEENVLASCTLDKQGKLELRDKRLILHRKDEVQIFPLNQIKKLDTKFRYFILPIIVGGIMAPFFLIATFSNYLAGMPGIIGITIGILLLYYGFTGSYQLSIDMEHSVFNLFVDEKTPELEAFVRAVNLFRSKQV